MPDELKYHVPMAGKGSAASKGGRKPWAALRLIDYGSVQHLTQGSNGPVVDGSDTETNRKSNSGVAN